MKLTDHKINPEKVKGSAALSTLTVPCGFQCYVLLEHSHHPRRRPRPLHGPSPLPPRQPLATASLPSPRRPASSKQEPSRKGVGVSWGPYGPARCCSHRKSLPNLPVSGLPLLFPSLSLSLCLSVSLSLSLPCKIRSKKGLRNKTQHFSSLTDSTLKGSAMSPLWDIPVIRAAGGVAPGRPALSPWSPEQPGSRLLLSPDPSLTSTAPVSCTCPHVPCLSASVSLSQPLSPPPLWLRPRPPVPEDTDHPSSHAHSHPPPPPLPMSGLLSSALLDRTSLYPPPSCGTQQPQDGREDGHQPGARPRAPHKGSLGAQGPRGPLGSLCLETQPLPEGGRQAPGTSWSPRGFWVYGEH